MKRLACAAALLAMTLLPACATSERQTAIAHPSNVRVSEVYYDGHYGPLYSGFWGPDSYFYYSISGPVHRRDSGRHVRRQAANGFREVAVPDRMHTATRVASR